MNVDDVRYPSAAICANVHLSLSRNFDAALDCTDEQAVRNTKEQRLSEGSAPIRPLLVVNRLISLRIIGLDGIRVACLVTRIVLQPPLPCDHPTYSSSNYSYLSFINCFHFQEYRLFSF